MTNAWLKAKTEKIPPRARRVLKLTLGVTVGGGLGFGYYALVGCNGGS